MSTKLTICLLKKGHTLCRYIYVKIRNEPVFSEGLTTEVAELIAHPATYKEDILMYMFSKGYSMYTF